MFTRSFRQKYNCGNSAFTILEIIIVVIIIAILTSLAIPKFANLIERSRSTEAILMLKEARLEVEKCYINKLSYANCLTAGTNALQSLMASPNNHFTLIGSVFAGPDSWYLSIRRNTRELGVVDTGGLVPACGALGAASWPWSTIQYCHFTNREGILGSGLYNGLNTIPP